MIIVETLVRLLVFASALLTAIWAGTHRHLDPAALIILGWLVARWTDLWMDVYAKFQKEERSR